jgi:1,2-diacylglycerol 3-alpha-glucosyltransferase
MKIALVATGLGRVLRGFESFTESLFQTLRHYAPHVNVTLFQGGGQRGDRRIVIPNLHRNDAPARWFGYEKANLLEQRSFALCIYPLLRHGHFDIVHYNELVMGSALYHLRRYFGGKFKLLYCNGAPSPPIHYHHRCDFAQILTHPAYQEAREFGLPEHRLFLIPYGVDAHRFSPKTQSARSAIRHELGIPEEVKVILTVGALKREHKRIDYLIREISKMDESVWLLAAGQKTDETLLLEEEAVNLLPGRWRFVSSPHEKVNLLYGAADVFVLASLTEGFGLVTVEAMLSGLPAIIHQNTVNRWITDGTSVRLINMVVDGELRKVLQEVLHNGDEASSREKAKERFSWERLIPFYLEMYKQLLRKSSKTVTHGQ